MEGIKYYSDSPAFDSEVEAVSIQKNDEDYYQPFKNQRGVMIHAHLSSQCEDIESMFVCKEVKLCSWDDQIKTCVFSKPKPVIKEDNNDKNKDKDESKDKTDDPANSDSGKSENGTNKDGGSDRKTKKNLSKFRNYFYN